MEFFSRDIRQPDAALLETMMTAGAQIGLYVARKWAADELETFSGCRSICSVSPASMGTLAAQSGVDPGPISTRRPRALPFRISSIPTIAPPRSTPCRR
jgi:hypothetical protein